MRAHRKETEDSQIIRRLVGWAEKTRSAVKKGKSLPACSKFMLTSFVNTLCSIHRRRTLSDETGERIECFDHQYLYIALRLTYDLQLQTKCKVSMLLREIFLCEGSLQAIFSILNQPQSAMIRFVDININVYTLYDKFRQFDHSAFGYFVKNICPLGRDIRERAETVYTPENVLNKTIDTDATTPLLAATKLGDPDLVLLLLRHGADPLLCQGGDDLDFPQKSPVGFTINALNMSMRMDLASPQHSAEINSSATVLRESAEKALLLLSYFSRAVYALDIRESSKFVDTGLKAKAQGQTPTSTTASVFFEVHPRVTKLIDVSAFSGPPSLAHACRHAIRDSVRQAGRKKIPTALKMLPVPRTQRRFLDLRS